MDGEAVNSQSAEAVLGGLASLGGLAPGPGPRTPPVDIPAAAPVDIPAAARADAGVQPADAVLYSAATASDFAVTAAARRPGDPAATSDTDGATLAAPRGYQGARASLDSTVTLSDWGADTAEAGVNRRADTAEAGAGGRAADTEHPAAGGGATPETADVGRQADVRRQTAGAAPETAGAAREDGADAGGADGAAHGEPSDVAARPTIVTESLTVTALAPEVRAAPAVWDAHRVVTELYLGEYKSLVRLAVLLVHDVQTAEEVVQDAFEAMHTAWRRLRDSEKALSYLRQAVVNRSRSILRHRTVVDKNAPKPAPDEPSAEQAAMALIERSAVIDALRTLPERQREAIVLRYYADLSEADIAATMGISRGAVKSHTARAMAALKSILEQGTT